MKNLKKKGSMSMLLNLCLIVYLFYYSYRYILKYNSEGTSPTYSNTPLLFQMAKFILLALILLAMIILILCNEIKFKHRLILLWLTYFCLQNMYAFFITKESSRLTTTICSLVAFCVIFFGRRIELKSIDLTLRVFLYFTIIYELIQIFLFVVFKRLPALGYNTGVITDVRFGGAWDDPNSFSVLLAFFIPYVTMRYKGLKRLVLLLTLSVFLIITWSLTGIFAFLGCLACIIFYNFIITGRAMKIKYIVLFSLSVLLVVIGCVIFWEKIVLFLSNKQSSIEQHLDSWNLEGVSIYTFIGILPIDRFSESSVLGLLFSGGLLNVLLFYSVSIIVILRLNKIKNSIIPKSSDYHIYSAMLYYVITFLIASINLPFISIFSNIGIFMVFLSISIVNEPMENPLDHKIIKKCVSVEGSICF